MKRSKDEILDLLRKWEDLTLQADTMINDVIQCGQASLTMNDDWLSVRDSLLTDLGEAVWAERKEDIPF